MGFSLWPMLLPTHYLIRMHSQAEDPNIKQMESSVEKILRKSEPSTTVTSSMSDARFLQSLLLATPLYFYYPHLTPPGFFSSLLKGLVQMRKTTEEQSRAVEYGIDLTNGRQATSKTGPGKRKSVCDVAERKANKKSKDRIDSSPKLFPRGNNSPEQSHNVSPSLS